MVLSTSRSICKAAPSPSNLKFVATSLSSLGELFLRKSCVPEKALSPEKLLPCFLSVTGGKDVFFRLPVYVIKLCFRLLIHHGHRYGNNPHDQVIGGGRPVLQTTTLGRCKYTLFFLFSNPCLIPKPKPFLVYFPFPFYRALVTLVSQWERLLPSSEIMNGAREIF